MKSNSDDARRFERAIAICAALSELAAVETRFELLLLIALGPRCGRDLRASTGLGHSLVSTHLRTMREAGVVVCHRKGRFQEYRLVEDVAAAAYAGGELRLHIRTSADAGITLHLAEKALPPGAIAEIKPGGPDQPGPHPDA